MINMKIIDKKILFNLFIAKFILLNKKNCKYLRDFYLNRDLSTFSYINRRDSGKKCLDDAL